ncbi:adhesion G-protein coupled receptor D1-like [Oculina patagonica]
MTRGLKSVAALLPLLSVTWLLGFVVHWSEVLLYLFIILNSLQGPAFCIFHSLLDDQKRESLIRSIRRTRMKHMARIDRSSIASINTQLTPPGSINGRLNYKHCGEIQTPKSYDTQL